MENRQTLEGHIARATATIAVLAEQAGEAVGKVAHALGMACQALKESARFSREDVYLIHALGSAANQIANAAASLGGPHGSYAMIEKDIDRLRKAANEVMDHTYGTIGAACHALLMACDKMQQAIAEDPANRALFALPMAEIATAVEILTRLVPEGSVLSGEQGFTDVVKERLSESAERVVAFGQIEEEQIEEDIIRYKSKVYLNGHPITHFSFRPGDKVWALKDETAVALGLEKHMHYGTLNVGQERVKAVLEQADSELIRLCVDANRGFTS